MKRCSDKRLKSLIRKALLAIEDPEKNILLDDFDLRYREREAKREADSARHYYRDKTPFETKYGEDCDVDGNEPAWTSDGGQGAETFVGIVSYALHGDEDCEDDEAKPSGKTSDWNRRRKSALERVRRRLPHALATLKLILKKPQQQKGIDMLASEIATRYPKEWELARQKYVRDLGDLTRLFTNRKLTR